MTATPAQEREFADLLDELLQQLLEGVPADRAALAQKHPAVAHRIDEALALAEGVAGRRSSSRPSLPGYEIQRELGRGGMGTVYLARQLELDRTVALKVLPHSLGLSAHGRQRFVAEARMLARVEHESIVRIHRIVDEGDLLAFEMEFVDGPSLQQLLDHLRAERQRTGRAATLDDVAAGLGVPVESLGARTPMQFFVRTVLAVARALGVVHGLGLVHRDVKPANVLLRRDGRPVLVDFGLARWHEHDGTNTRGFAGTPTYASPEQLAGEGAVGPPADVYALAATLYECLALSPPFRGRTTTEVMRAIEQGRCVPLRRAAPGTPKDLETIVGHALDLRPDRRYRDGGELADDLQRLLDLQPIAARPLGPVRRLLRQVRRNQKLLLAGAVGAVLVLLALLPLLQYAQQANERREQARVHLGAARHHLLMLVSVGALGRPSVAAAGPLQQAIDEYERSLALDDRAEVRRERDVARVARWLRGLQVPTPDALGQALASDEFRQLLAPLGPGTAAEARRLAAGSGARAVAPPGLALGDPDRADIGLLAFLCGDVDRSEEAWSDLGPGVGEDPLIDAASGILHLRQGRPELAYLHLERAQRGFPDPRPMALDLAEASLELGDLDAARRWLGVAPDDDPTRRGCLVLDLRVAAGETQDLRRDYAALAAAAPTDPLPRLRLAQLTWRAGDAAGASRLLEELLATWPDHGRARLERARLALHQRDAGSYLEQVLAVLEHADRAPRRTGANPLELEVLRLGGLLHLAPAAPAGERGERWLAGGDVPLRTFLPAPVLRSVEALVPTLLAIRRQVARIAGAEGASGDPLGTLLIATPWLAAQLPWPSLQLPERLALALVMVPRLWSRWWPQQLPRLVQDLRTLWLTRLSDRWQQATMQRVSTPEVRRFPQLLGNALLTIDDATGDGRPDVLVGAESLRPTEVEGGAFVVDGRTGTVVAELSTDDPTRMFGHALAAAGDVDGDGCVDWLIGAPSGTPSAAHGRVELWTGRTQQRLWAVDGGGPGFGVAVASPGDVDGDGVPDIAVADVPMLRNQSPQGSVQLLSGRTREVLRTFVNDVPGVWFGASLAAIGDVDGDGRRDLLVGGNYGGAPGLVRLYSTSTGAILQAWASADPATGFGTCVLGVGDVDGDGRDDVAVSSVRLDTSGSDQVMLLSSGTGRCLATLTRRAGGCFGQSLGVFRPGPGGWLLAVGMPDAGSGGRGGIEFWSPGGLLVSTVFGPATGRGFGGSLAVLPDDDGDGYAELFAGPGVLSGNVWRVPSRQIRFPR